MTPEGFIRFPSRYTQGDTLARLEVAVAAHGMAVMAHVDHAVGAAEAGLALRPADVLLFGNARAGTPLMQKAPTIAIDLPLRALVWQDANGTTWLGINDPAWLAARHALPPDTPPLAAMQSALHAAAVEAAGAPGQVL